MMTMLLRIMVMISSCYWCFFMKKYTGVLDGRGGGDVGGGGPERGRGDQLFRVQMHDGGQPHPFVAKT